MGRYWAVPKSASAPGHFQPCLGQESGNWFLVHTEPSGGQILSFQLGKGGKATGALWGVVRSLCNNYCGKPQLWIAQSFSDFTPSSLHSLWSMAFPCPTNWDFFHSSAEKKNKKRLPFSEEVEECFSRQLKTATQQWFWAILSSMVPDKHLFPEDWIIRVVAVTFF